MINLINPEEIKKLDPKNVYGSTGMLAKQCRQIWQDTKKVSFDPSCKNIKNIVICGMGGSAYGAHVVQSLFKEELTAPLILNSDYHLPGFVNESTLVILTTYSGSTEETLNCGQEALKRKAKVTGLTSGGLLSKFIKKNKLPALIFNPKFNPCGQPRLGTGYIVVGTIALLNRIGLIKIDEKTVITAINELIENQKKIKTRAMDIANEIEGKIPIFFASEFLGGNAHLIRNQFNETAKSFSAFAELPELNHHLMEGLKNPRDKRMIVVFLESEFYSETLKKRNQLTKAVVKRNNIPVLGYQAEGTTKLSQMLNVLSFGGYASLYLALIYGLDPSLIPWVDYFKEQLKK